MTSDISTKVDTYFSQYPLRHYPKGQIIVFAGENPDYIFYLKKGHIRKYDVSYKGDEVVVNVFKPGSFFPMSWALNKSPNQFFYKTESETDVHIVPCDKALAFVTENPDVAIDLLSRLYIGMDGILGRMVQLMSGTARSRLLYEVLVECRRSRSKKPGQNYLLSINEGDLASRSGLSRETVSREMQKIKAEGLVIANDHRLEVPDLAAIEDKLGIDTH